MTEAEVSARRGPSAEPLSGADECSEFTKVRARRNSCDASEVVDQMGLIDISEIRGNVGSVGIGKRESLQHFL